MDNWGTDLLNRDIKKEIEDIKWKIQHLSKFETINAMSQPDEDNFKKVAQDMENAVNRLNSLLLKEKYSKYYWQHDNMFSFFVCEKSRTFARSEEEATTDRHERAKTADFKAELILSIDYQAIPTENSFWFF